MLPLTRPVRQVLATLVLVGLTVIPTAYVAVLAWRINRPGHVRDVEIELGRRLGLQVTLSEVKYPRPNEVVYRDFVLRHEERHSGALSEILRADEVRVSTADRELSIHLENPRIRSDSPRLGLGQLGAFLEQSSQVPFERINVIASTCALDLGSGSPAFTLKDLAGEYLADRSIPTVRAAYRVPGHGSGTRCELILSRDRRGDEIASMLSLKSVEGPPLPVKVLDLFFDAEDWLGADATLDGEIALRQNGSRDWEAEFRGELLDLDLGRLIGKRFPRHRLTGRARLKIDAARWGERPGQGPGWIEAKGGLLAGQGSIGIELVDALAREMSFRPAPKLEHLDPRKTDVEFRALGFAFAMEQSGEIQISGSLGSELPPDAVLAGPTTALLSAPQGTASVLGLIKTLFPISQASKTALVPLTAESHVLLSLPIPPGSSVHAGSTVDGN
jgi:hypothetical protein